MKVNIEVDLSECYAEDFTYDSEIGACPTSSLSEEVVMVIKDEVYKANDCDFAEHFRTFGICFECGEIHENYNSACCDNCGDMTVHSFDEAMEAALDD